MATTIYIIEDDEAVSEALEWLFYSVRFETEVYSSAQSFLNNCVTNKKGCIIIDVRLPDMSGLDLQDKLNQQGNQLPILFLTGHGDIAMAVRAVKAGAYDFMTKPFENQQLLEQVQRALAGNGNSKAPQSVFEDIEQSNQRIPGLTRREQLILELIADGKLNKEIAAELHIALSTVELHRSRVMEKMGAKNSAHLIKRYLQLTPALQLLR